MGVDRRCPHPEKLAWKRLQQAQSFATQQAKTHGDRLRPYRCQCTLWHLTSKVYNPKPQFPQGCAQAVDDTVDAD